MEQGMEADSMNDTQKTLFDSQPEQQPGETPNAYELRQERRRERLLDAAERAKQSAEGHRHTADRMASVIPFGQPILVGHHSEKADRRYRARIHGHMGKWIAETKHAEELERKAASVGTGGISSDDPDAISKLQAQLASLEAMQERMKAGNRIVRDKSLTDEQKVEKLTTIGLTHENAWRALKLDFCGRVGFPDYALQNNNANVRRIRERIEEMQERSQQTADPQPITGQGFQISEDRADNRILIIFDAKPPQPIRELLKRSGWRWSPTREAWVRMLNNAGRASAQYVTQKLCEAGASQERFRFRGPP
jgi:hypothetical protein